MVEHIVSERYRLTLSGMYKDDEGDWVKYEEVERLQARVDELEAALRGYVKATTGQESATVKFPMALEGEVK